MKKVLHVLFPILVYFVAHDIMQMIMYMSINFLGNEGGYFADLLIRNSKNVASFVQCLAMLLGILFLLPYIKEVKGLVPEGKKEHSKQEDKKAFCNYCLISAGAVFISLGLNILILNMSWANNSAYFKETSASQNAVPIIMGVLLFGIVSPFVEEYLFRGLVFGRMKSLFTVEISIVASALFFGIYHKNVVQGIYGFLMGVMLAYIYERMQNIWASFLFHAIANLTVYLGTQFVDFGEMSWLLGIAFLIIGAVFAFMFVREADYKHKKHEK